MMFPNEQAATFFSALLHGVPTSWAGYFYQWDPATKICNSFAVADPNGIASATAWSEPPANRYVAVSLGAAPVPPYSRLKSYAAAGFLGTYVDIDVAGPAHRKPNLPPTDEAAHALLEEFGPPPTILVHSGHGLQAWWLLKEAWMFDSEEDRSAAGALAKGWVDALRDTARPRGWDVDAVGDLARLLRSPGTINAKPGCEPVPVKLLCSEGPRYTREELLDHASSQAPPLLALPAAEPSNSSAVGLPFEIDRDAEPPPDKLTALLEHPRARGSWDHQRPDLDDQSGSAYDMSLATLAVLADWDDQEIVNLLIARRRRYGESPKNRADYFVRTLRTARRPTDPADDPTSDDDAAAGEGNVMASRIKTEGVVPVLADDLEDRHFFAQDAGGLLHVYQDGRYVPAAKWLGPQIRCLLEEWDTTKQWRKSTAAELIHYLLCNARRLWERPPLHTLNVRNGLLDVQTRELRPHSHTHLSSMQLPVSYDSEAACPNIERFVESSFPQDAAALAYQLVAFTMLPDPSLQKAVLLIGGGGNGKSVYLRLLQQILGRENYSTVPLQRLEGERFAASRLDGMLANICADLPATDLRGSSVFKGITGGDRITAERKYHDSYDFYPYCKLIFSANTPPRTPDASGAFFARWVVIPFERTFRGETIEIASAELDASMHTQGELSGLLNRALDALAHVREHGLSEPLSCVQAKEEFRAATDPLAVWMTRNTISVPTGWIPKKQLLDAYNADAHRLGHPVKTANGFSRDLKASMPQLKDGQRTHGNSVVGVWLGLTIRTDPGAPSATEYSSQSPEFPIAAEHNR